MIKSASGGRGGGTERPAKAASGAKTTLSGPAPGVTAGHAKQLSRGKLLPCPTGIVFDRVYP
jgi:hypothetical protein